MKSTQERLKLEDAPRVPRSLFSATEKQFKVIINKLDRISDRVGATEKPCTYGLYCTHFLEQKLIVF